MKKITGGLTIGILILSISQPITVLASEVEDACINEEPNYEELMKLWDDADTKDQNTYEETFSAMQEAHHGYVGCLFEFAENKILKSDGAEHSGTMGANIANASRLPLYLGEAIDWMSPDEACLTRQEIKQVIYASEPTELLTPVLQAHTNYRENLQDLQAKYGMEGGITDNTGKALTGITALNRKSIEYDRLDRQYELEVESSLLAIDLMFHSLKELRLAFVMHVNFQCTLQYLGDYRRALGDLRDVIEPLPDKLKDASSS